jgi:thiamine phosphate synthase YjbQ (UPF0047 family)
MKIYREEISLQSQSRHPTFHDITKQVNEIVARSGVKNGQVVIYSHHTTCSVMTQECSHDETYWGLEYLQQDLVEIMDRLVPQCRTENQYRHPGPKHIEFAMSLGHRGIPGEQPEEGEWTSLNTDAHLRSVFFGRSETIVIIDGHVDLGEFGYIYFVDWDQLRARKRVAQVQVMGV